MSETVGKNLRALLENTFKEKHEYANTSLESFSDLDRGFYETATRAFQAQGFTWVGDVEDLTLTRANPSQRTCARVFVGGGGQIQGAVYHLKIRGAARLFQWIGLIPRQIKVIDLETEFQTGVFIGTTNAPIGHALTHGPRILRQFHRGAGLEQLLEIHRRRVKEHALTNNASVVLVGTLASVIESQQRHNLLEALHRKSVNGLTKEELAALGGAWVSENVINEVYREVRDAAK
jgi:HAMP domain-containing protein